MNTNEQKVLEILLNEKYDKSNPAIAFRRAGINPNLMNVSAGAPVLLQNQPAVYLYFILSGRVSIVNNIEFTTNDILDSVESPHILGLVENLTGVSVYTASAIAETNCILYRIRADEFIEAIKENNYLCFRSLVIMTKIASLNMELAEAHRTFQNKDILGFHLYQQAKVKVPYICKLTRAELSVRLNINLRSLYRYLDAMKAAGDIQIIHGKIIIEKENFERLSIRYGNVVM